MARKVREILKGYFKTGQRPTEQNFEDLIDSAMNVLEDSSYRTSENGFLLTYPDFERNQENRTLVSICPEPLPESENHIKWKIGIDENENLHIQSPSKNGQDPWENVLTFNSSKASDGNRHEVNIAGTLSCKSRKGNYKSGEINANGKWHDILEEEEGCRAFEIVAGCEQKETGCYALMVAIAMHCFGKGRKIRKVHSYSGSFGNRLCLRLVKVKGKPACKLQIKTFFNYGDNAKIYYRITNLWDNPTTK